MADETVVVERLQAQLEEAKLTAASWKRRTESVKRSCDYLQARLTQAEKALEEVAAELVWREARAKINRPLFGKGRVYYDGGINALHDCIQPLREKQAARGVGRSASAQVKTSTAVKLR